MTTPTPCTCGEIVQLGDRVGKMRLWLRPGRVFDGTIQLRGKDTGLPEDWPAGMEARLVLSWGTGTELMVPGSVDASFLRFHMDPDETETVPQRATGTIQLRYAGDTGWRDWVEGGGCA